MSSANVWTIVLAAGEGSRLSGVALGADGRPVPKQFWRIDQKTTMLEWTLARASRLSARDHIVPIVSAKHRHFWETELRTLPIENVIVQPENRGTAAGILLPLLHVLRRDPDATIVVLPSDHHVADEEVLTRSIRRAQLAVEAEPEAVVLLGMTPDSPDPELGWIQPARGQGMTRPVGAFVEKPSAEIARGLWAQGALWNSFMFVAKAITLAHLFERTQRDLLADFINGVEGAGWGATSLERLYARVPSRDFSREVFQRAPDALRVLPVPACGWSDLGTPPRVEAWREAAATVPAAITEGARRAMSRTRPIRVPLAMPAPVPAMA